MTNCSLRQRVTTWNGKSVDHIQIIYRDFHQDDGFIETLIDMITNNETEVGSSWLLKHHFEQKHSITSDQIVAIYQALPRLHSWGATLHLLQCMVYIPIPKKLRKSVEHCVRRHITDDNKFVRAWAYNGFYLLANTYPEYQSEALQLFEMALRDESASVKARVRKLVHKGF